MVLIVGVCRTSSQEGFPDTYDYSFINEDIDMKGKKDLKSKFNATGLSHLTAVSGSNIVIIISILMSLLMVLRFWRGQAFYFSVIFIWLYIILIGFPVSGIRAAIMGSVALLAQKIGRQNS